MCLKVNPTGSILKVDLELEFSPDDMLKLMEISLSKLLASLVYPTGLIFFLLMFAIILRKKTRWWVGAVITALIVLILAGNRWTAFSLVRFLERQHPPLELPVNTDAIVVLGGATEVVSDPRQMIEVNGAGDRVIYAAYLYRQGAAPRVLVSGGRIDGYAPTESSQAQEMADLLVFMGVPSENIILEEQARNTAENAQFSGKLLQDLGAERVLLVTSALHMPRALPLFAALGIEVIPAPTDTIVSDADWQALVRAGPATQILNLLPSAGSLNLTTSALKEFLGYLVNLLGKVFQ